MKKTQDIRRSLSVIMTTYHQWALTQRCLDSLLLNSCATHRLVIVDNGSTDETRSELKKYQPLFESQGIDFIVYESDTNLGFAKGMNTGLAVLRTAGLTDYVAVANNDTYLSKDWDLKLIQSLERNQADCVSPFVLEVPFTDAVPDQLEKLAIKNQNRKRKQWSMILGVFRRSVIEELGLFDPRYFVGYEDADLKHRFDLKHKVYYTVGDAVIWHHSKGSRGEDQGIERFGLETFLKIWGFDPRLADHTFFAKWVRSWRKWKLKFGYL
jgi:GT2 family glycosyltransferase